MALPPAMLLKALNLHKYICHELRGRAWRMKGVLVHLVTCIFVIGDSRRGRPGTSLKRLFKKLLLVLAPLREMQPSYSCVPYEISDFLSPPALP